MSYVSLPVAGIDTSTQIRVYVASDTSENAILRYFLSLRGVLSSSFDLGDERNTSLVDAGTPLGATAVVTPGSVVVYLVSAASWRPFNVADPHQGPVTHS